MTEGDESKYVQQIRAIRIQFRVTLAVLALIVLPVAVLALRNSDRASDNANKITDVERADKVNANRAQWRGCARDMLERANDRVSTEAVLKLPGLKELFTPRLIEEGIRRQEELLPILNCDPNLCDTAPYGMSRRDQRRFVDLFAAGILTPTPSPPRTHHCPVGRPPLQMRVSESVRG